MRDVAPTDRISSLPLGETEEEAGVGSNGVTVTKFLQLLMILELSYSLGQIFIVVTVTEVTKVPKFLI